MPQGYPSDPDFSFTPGGKGPPTAAGTGCGPNGTGETCHWMGSAITFVSPNKLYGQSFTWTQSPWADWYLNFATAKMLKDGLDLGNACPQQSTSQGANVATARVPCYSPTNFYLYSPSLFTLVGRHRAQAGLADTGILETYNHLGAIAAGTTRDFANVAMGSFCNYVNASGPTVLPNDDGVTAQYTGKTATTVSFRFNAPYSARKGFHQLGFPANDNYGNPRPNPHFGIIVYDGTPVIDGVTPDPILTGAATTLTVTGRYFGDHPTMYVAGTSYNLGAPSRNAQGQDVSSFELTLPSALPGSPVPVCVFSNGAGGQPFFGEPQGPQQGSPTSNTVQVQGAAPPAISGNPGIWYLGTASGNDNCVPGSSDPSQSCYYNSTLLTVTPGAGGTPPTSGSPATWSLTFGQVEPFATHTCDDAACSRILLRATSQPPTCGAITVQATIGGISSEQFTVYVDWPSRALFVDNPIPDQGLTALGDIGYFSTNRLRLLSACGSPMFFIDLHEEFPGPWQAGGGSTGWTDPIPQQPTDPNDPSTGWGSWTSDGDGRFIDYIAYKCFPGVAPCSPPSDIPGPRKTPPEPLSTQANAWAAQFFFVGSKDTQNLGKYFTTAPNSQVRYKDHGRSEPGWWRCPVQ